MSIMTKAVIQMPYKIALNSEYSRRQFYSHAQVLLAENNILKAEIAGLKTGYEAYERVNADLKAENDRLAAHIADGMDHKAVAVKGMARLTTENEALRKDADRYQWLRDKSEAINQFYLSVPLWFSGVRFRKEDVDSGIDAAMGKGEQS